MMMMVMRLRTKRQENNLNANLFFRQGSSCILLARATSCLSKVMILVEVELLRPCPLGK